MSRPSSSPRGEHTPRPGHQAGTQARSTEDQMTELHELLGLDPADPATAAAMQDSDAVADLILALADARTTLGLTQGDVAERMGTTAAEVADFERVGGDPRFSTVQRYARAVGYRLTTVLTEAAADTTPHRYLSTACLHGEHGYCQSHTGLSGAKTPAQCKFCKARCGCSCHQQRPA